MHKLLDFSEALLVLKQGLIVRKVSWDSPDIFLCNISNVKVIVFPKKILNLINKISAKESNISLNNYSNLRLKSGLYRISPGIVEKWYPTGEDLNAKDWVI